MDCCQNNLNIVVHCEHAKFWPHKMTNWYMTIVNTGVWVEWGHILLAVMISDHKSGNIRKYYKISENDQYNKRRPYHFIAGHRLLFIEWKRGGHGGLEWTKLYGKIGSKNYGRKGRVGWWVENLVELWSNGWGLRQWVRLLEWEKKIGTLHDFYAIISQLPT